MTKYIYKDKGKDIESVLAILCETFRKVFPILESFESYAMAWICLLISLCGAPKPLILHWINFHFFSLYKTVIEVVWGGALPGSWPCLDRVPI